MGIRDNNIQWTSRGYVLFEEDLCGEGNLRRIPVNQPLSQVYGEVKRNVKDLSNQTQVLRVRCASKPRNGCPVRAERNSLSRTQGPSLISMCIVSVVCIETGREQGVVVCM